MKEAIYTSYEKLLLFLNAETLAKLLGVSVSSSYEKGFSRDQNRLAVSRSQRKTTTLDRRENRKVRCR